MARGKWASLTARRRNFKQNVEREQSRDGDQQRMAVSERLMEDTALSRSIPIYPPEPATQWDRDARRALSLERPLPVSDQFDSEKVRQIYKGWDDILPAAFRRHRLDPNSPDSWRTMLTMYVALVNGFPKLRAKGQPRKSVSAEFKAAAAVARAKLKGRGVKLSDSKIAAQMFSADRSGKFGKAETIRKHLRKLGRN